MCNNCIKQDLLGKVTFGDIKNSDARKKVKCYKLYGYALRNSQNLEHCSFVDDIHLVRTQKILFYPLYPLSLGPLSLGPLSLGPLSLGPLSFGPLSLNGRHFAQGYNIKVEKGYKYHLVFKSFEFDNFRQIYNFSQISTGKCSFEARLEIPILRLSFSFLQDEKNYIYFLKA